MRTKSVTAFTLIELLVVVTIIVVLLALLTPALDKAIYQAEVVRCMTNLKVAANGFITYASGNSRRYPDRGLKDARNVWGVAAYMITDPTEGGNGGAPGFDMRPMLRDLFSINKTLNDPLAKAVDLEWVAPVPDHYVFDTYNLYFGWTYKMPAGGPGMMKLGDRWTYDNQRFNILACDFDFYRNTGAQAAASHGDNHFLVNQVFEYAVSPFGGHVTSSLWANGGTADRDPLDLNFAYDDGSVRRLDQVVYVPGAVDGSARGKVTGTVNGTTIPPALSDDPRMTRVPNLFDVDDAAMVYVPRQ